MCVILNVCVLFMWILTDAIITTMALPAMEGLQLKSVEVTTSTSTSIHVSWTILGEPDVTFEGYSLRYNKLASAYHKHVKIESPNTRSYNIDNLITDTFYKVCVWIVRNETVVKNPVEQCIDASTASWQLPVSIGSSIGAVLALSIIVFIVLLSRCPALIRKRRQSQHANDAAHYDSISSQFQDQDNFDYCEHSQTAHDDEGFSEQDVEALAPDGSIPLRELKRTDSCDDSIESGGNVCNGNHPVLFPVQQKREQPRRTLPKQMSLQEDSTKANMFDRSFVNRGGSEKLVQKASRMEPTLEIIGKSSSVETI